MKYRLVPRLSLSCLAATLAPLAANPIDPTPTVVTGQVDFIGLDTHSAIINQASQKAIVDYSHFNIPEGGSVQFIQPNSNAAILNRITGADPSLLNGTLTANGQVFFVNPAGVTFGANSVIRADVFMAAAGQMSNEDFLNNIQNFSLTGNIQNFGSIKTERGVGLFGQQVENAGEIVAKNGYAIVASGDEVHVRQGGTGLSVDVTDSARATKSGTGIKNLGTVDSEEVMFSAGDAFATAIQQSGKVSARKSAKIQSDGGAVEVSGEISVRNESGQGGRIEVGGTDLGAETAPVSSSTTIAETAVLDASSESGDGGHIVVYSGGHTQFDGVANATSSSGNGGFIEASGKTLDFNSLVETIILESGGHFLIDPEEITIDTNPANPFNASSIETLLDGGTSVTVMTDSNIPGNGNINVDANIQVPTNNLGNQGSLKLDADGDIIVAGGVTVENLQEDFAPGETVFDFQAGGDIILNGDVRHSGTNGETGRGSIAMTSVGEVYLNNTIIDANGGSVIIDADEVTLFNFSSSILSGLVGEDTASVDITAASEVNFAGGNIQTFGGADVFIDTALLTNNTGSTAIARTDLAESFFGIRLPNPEDNGSGTNHIYGGIQSGARALFDVTDFGPVKAGGISGNQYYYNFQPTVGIAAKDGSKIYGNTFNLPSGGAAVNVATGDFVPVPLGDPFLADTSANSLDLSGVTTTSAGAVTTADVGDYNITATGATSNNGYSFDYTPGTLTVEPRAITLTASEQDKQYGDILSLDDTAFSVTDLDLDSTLPNGDTVNTVTLVSNTGVDSSTTTGATTYGDEISITGQSGNAEFNANNYDITYETGDLVVDPRNVTVTASEQEKFYGDVLDLTSNASQTSFTIVDNGLTDSDGNSSTLPNGESIDTVSLQSVLPVDVAASTTESVGTYNDELRITGVSGDPTFDVNNYNLTFVDGNLIVARRPISLTPDAQSKEYGDVLPLGTTAFTVLDNRLTEGGDAALPNGEQIDTVPLVSTGGVAASTDADAATYTDNIGIDNNAFASADGSNGFNLDNYDVTFLTGDLTIDPRQIELIAGRQEKFYGDGLPLDNTTFTVVDQGNALDNALPNREEVSTVTISSATGVDSSSSADASLYSNEIVIESPVTGTPGTGDGFLESNYDITFTSGDLLVKPRPITVTPTQQEKTYGDTLVLANDNTAFSVTDLDGDSALPNGEAIDTVGIISLGGHDSSTTSDAVTYQDDLEITAFGTGSNGFNADNYTFDFSNLGDFVINRRAAQIVASAQEKDYGDVHDLGDTAFTVIDRDGGALPNGETVNAVTLVSANGVDASTDVDAGSYTGNISVTPTSTGTSTITGSANFNQENYTFSYGTGDFNVNQRAITLTASQQEKIYGNTLNLDDTAFTTLDRDGGTALPNGEVVTNVTINSVTGVDASTTSDVATYTDEIVIESPVTGTPGTGDGFLESNYDITYVSGDLAVNKRAITVTALPQSKTYGETITLDTTSFSVVDLDGGSALPNGESIDAITITSSVAGDSTANVGTYTDDLAPTDIVASSNGFDENNYDVTRVTGDFTIDQRAILLTALDQEKIYGNSETLDNTAFTVADTFGGGGSALPNGEIVNTVVFDPTTVPGDTTASAGVYTDEVSIADQVGGSGFAASNYDISYTPGNYTINRRAIELVIAGDDRFAGAGYEIDPAAFATIDLDGDAFLPNGESIDTLDITSLTGVAEDPSSPMGLYLGELTANPASAIGSNGFSLANYDITVTPGDFKIDPYPGLPSVAQDVYFEQWLRDNIGLDLENPFLNSYAISQSLGLRLITLDSWVKLPGARKQAVLRSLDAVPLHLQTIELAEELIKKVK